MGRRSDKGFEDKAWRRDYKRYLKKFMAEIKGPPTDDACYHAVSKAVGAANALKIDRMMMGPEAATFEMLEAQSHHIPA